MAPVVVPTAGFIAELLEASLGTPWKILDIAAGHGLFGITLAEQNPNARVVALDWPKVLEVAQENARKAGLEDRYQLLRGSAFEVDFGHEYDLVLITNFFHHFDQDTCIELMQRIHRSLSNNGRAVTLEFVPNQDRISPRHAASFSLTMLVSTPSGDTYTFRQYQEMFQQAGFSATEFHPVSDSPQQVLISHKR
jgi:ubiquinone/menaquinone biosynthesis C-methylase UbiE